MKRRTTSNKLRRRAQFRRPLSRPKPAIVAGGFAGRKLSELSDDELIAFLRLDAWSQTTTALPNIFDPSKPPVCPDFSQYWFAKYELERRKKAPDPEPAARPLKLTANETKESIALKLLEYGFRAASRQYHPDVVGGDNRIMQDISAARDYARLRLK